MASSSSILAVSHILRKIIIIVATRCHLFQTIKMHQIRFSLRLCLRPHLGKLTALLKNLQLDLRDLLIARGRKKGKKRSCEKRGEERGKSCYNDKESE